MDVPKKFTGSADRELNWSLFVLSYKFEPYGLKQVFNLTGSGVIFINRSICYLFFDNKFGFPVAAGTGVMIQGKGPDFAIFHPGENFPGATCWLVGIPQLGKAAVIMTNGSKGTALAIEVLEILRAESVCSALATPAGHALPEHCRHTSTAAIYLFNLLPLT